MFSSMNYFSIDLIFFSLLFEGYYGGDGPTHISHQENHKESPSPQHPPSYMDRDRKTNETKYYKCPESIGHNFVYAFHLLCPSVKRVIFRFSRASHLYVRLLVNRLVCFAKNDRLLEFSLL